VALEGVRSKAYLMELVAPLRAEARRASLVAGAIVSVAQMMEATESSARLQWMLFQTLPLPSQSQALQS